MRAVLRAIDEASLRKICEITMLTQTETDILVCSLSRRLDANFIADKHNISVSTLQRKTLQAVQKVRFRLGISRLCTEKEIADNLEVRLFSTQPQAVQVATQPLF